MILHYLFSIQTLFRRKISAPILKKLSGIVCVCVCFDPNFHFLLLDWLLVFNFDFYHLNSESQVTTLFSASVEVTFILILLFSVPCIPDGINLISVCKYLPLHDQSRKF